jgi:solute carrier family 25 (mitochondrial oxoglutarate transporter), member 11
MQTAEKGHEFKGVVDCATTIVKQEGFIKGLYAGIGAAYLRQWLYGSCRIGIYSFLLEAEQAKHGNTPISLGSKMFMGMCSGGIGSLVGTPAELALVRMTADSKLTMVERRNYKGVGDCLSRIVQEEGIGALWRGATVTVIRAMVLSSCVLAVTSEVKQKLIVTGLFGTSGELFHGLPLLFCAIMVSSMVANIAANPFDVIKSRTQNQKIIKTTTTTTTTTKSDKKKNTKETTTTTSMKYKGMLDCLFVILKEEGFMTLWAGFVPAFIKLAPYTIISLSLTEKITEALTGRAAL